jgi:GrpB-like predicted nucleotidyltransferase (UPF0157 family)
VSPSTDPIIVFPYDPEWPQRFSAVGNSLRKALGEIALRIDHIGSTAVVGLDAKAIIDIQISVASLEPLDSFRIPMERLGYVFRADNPERTKRYFREAPGARRTHIHVRHAGSWPEQFSLLFRDYLRTHDEDAKAYARLKYNLAEHYRDNRHAYTDAKAPFIWEVMRKADQWCQETGWQPGPTDA